MTKLTIRKAVDQMCFDCIYDGSTGGHGGRLTQVTNCTSPKCPLYEHRPVNQATKDKRKAQRIANMTPAELEKYNARVDATRERFHSSKG